MHPPRYRRVQYRLDGFLRLGRACSAQRGKKERSGDGNLPVGQSRAIV
jgi:hypothetical protein